MAIHFSKLFYKNFLSTGNGGTTIQFDRNPTTLVQGASGSGKSTMIDALCFVLYGKPFRSINKPGLVNSVNGKQCEVQVEFSTNGKNYRVTRGIKPTKFEIHCDGVLVNQDAALRDYQQVLENQILMMTFKTFTQIVILGSTAYIPFMQLTTGARREVIEDILDIGIFSTMNQLLKVRYQETKDQQTAIDAEIKTKKEKAEGLKRLIDALSEKKDEESDLIKLEIEQLKTEIASIGNEISALVAENNELLEKTKKHKQLVEANNRLLEEVSSREATNKLHRNQISFFDANENCPTCSQTISDDHKKTMIAELTTKIAVAESKVVEMVDMRKTIKEKIDAINQILSNIDANNTQIKVLDSKTNVLQSRQISCVERLQTIQTENTDIETPKQELREVAKEVLSLVERRKELAEQRQLQENAGMLLRDTGIKTAIIKEYIPLINKYLNKYLSDMQLDIEFTLDENFNETVKSRYRDDFAYGNFSEGEKLRIDLALLLCWRQIAKAKNSTSCNLLILDEVLTGRLDQTNQDIVIDLINSISHSGTNVMIIAHADNLVDKFRGGIRFEKQGNFSVMV